MRIVSYLQSAVMRFINLEEFLPLGHSAIAPFLRVINERYGFQVDETANLLVGGTLTSGDEEIAVISFEIQHTRMVAVCSTTEQAVRFLDDAVEYLHTNHNFRKPHKALSDFISSAIVVDFDDNFLERIDIVRRLVDAMHVHLDNEPYKVEMQAQSLRFSGTIFLEKSRIGVHYSLEERTGRPFGSNWMFSQAPLPTDLHEKYLQDVVSIVGGLTPTPPVAIPART